MQRRFLLAPLLLLVAACSGTAAAQSGVILGTVLGAVSKKPLADVIVTATSPSLKGEQTVVTDVQGSYRIPQLPPGVYTLQFEANAYKPYTRSDIQLSVDRTIRVNVELLPSDYQEPASRP